MSESATPTPWTEESLESALMSMGRNISLRSIQNWRRGKAPSRQNIHRLARIASGDNPALQKQWRELFFNSLKLQSNKPDHLAELELQPLLSKPEQTSETGRKSWLNPALIAGTVLVAGAACIGFGVNLYVTDRSAAVKITDLRFCLERDFSMVTKRCMRAENKFPASAPRIYVSFETGEVPDGHPFERRWYFNGEIFLERDGFFDEAWENFTWLHKVGRKGPGKYVLRIIVDGKVTTGSFLLVSDSNT